MDRRGDLAFLPMQDERAAGVGPVRFGMEASAGSKRAALGADLVV
jgi:hypothetical protein